MVHARQIQFSWSAFLAEFGLPTASSDRSKIESRAILLNLMGFSKNMATLNSSLSGWRAVEAHARDIGGAHLRDLAAADPKRWQNFHLEHDSWLLDFSRQRISQETLALLLELAREAKLQERIAAMFRGDPINATEGRAVLHTALRSGFAGSAAIQAEVKESRRKLSHYAGAVRRGDERGVTGRKFKHVVNIGIGGSDLGPLLVCNALKAEWSGDITPHFVSNVDRTQLEDVIRSLDPAETLVIVCSKTFTTQETQANANAARAWIVAALWAIRRPRIILPRSRPTRRPWTCSASRPSIASRCGIGLAAATRSGRRSA